VAAERLYLIKTGSSALQTRIRLAEQTGVSREFVSAAVLLISVYKKRCVTDLRNS
jgi:hypothetical protein